MNAHAFNAILVIFGFSLIALSIYYTRNPNCLWAMLLVALLGVTPNKSNESEGEENEYN